MHAYLTFKDIPPLCLSWFKKCLEEKLLMLEKLDTAGLAPVDLYLMSRGVGFIGGILSRIDSLGEEFRSLNSFICCLIS